MEKRFAVETEITTVKSKEEEEHIARRNLSAENINTKDSVAENIEQLSAVNGQTQDVK